MNHIKSLLSIPVIIMVTCISSYSQKNYNLLFLDNKYDEIIDQAKSSIASNVDKSDDYYWLAYSIHEKGDTKGAICELENGLKKYQGDEKLEKLVGDYYYELGNFFKAKPIYRKYMKENKFLFKLCDILEANTTYSDAIVILEKVYEQDTVNINCLKHLAFCSYKIENYPKAELYYKKLVEILPHDQLSTRKLISIYNDQERYKESSTLCEKMLEYEPENPVFIKLAGFTAIKNNDYPKAKKLFNHVYAKGDSSLYVLKHLGLAELRCKEYKVGQELLHKAFLKDTTDYLVCYFLGDSYLYTKNRRQGIKYIERSIDNLKPKGSVMSAVLRSNASLHKAIKEYERSIELYLDAFRVGLDPRDLFFAASVYQSGMKDYEMALEYFKLFLNHIEGEEEEKPKGVGINIKMSDLAKRHIEEIKTELFFRAKK